MSIDIEITGVEELRAALTGLPPDLRLELRKQLSAAAAIVRDEAVERIWSPGGHAKKGIKIRMSGSGVDTKARIYPGNRAAIFSMRGRGPGKLPPPRKAARAMVRRYWHSPYMPYPAGSRALALAIAAHGTPKHPIMQAVKQATHEEVTRLFREAMERVARMRLARR